MDQWGYSEQAGRRYNGNPPPNQPPMAREREYNGNAQAQAYEYQGGLAHSHSASPNGDIAMQDAGDPYNSQKYPIRPHHQSNLSSGRGASHDLPSAAATRYSPMETLSPTSQQYGSRQSPTRPGNFSSPTSYYGSRQQNQQLPPITPYSSNNEGYPASATQQLNAVFGNDPKSPRRPVPQSQGPPGRGPVPEFTKIRSAADLQPKVNAQPAFRRANPEGGFISVSVSQGMLKNHLLT
jgi:dual specificity protein kinase YAK1